MTEDQIKKIKEKCSECRHKEKCAGIARPMIARLGCPGPFKVENKIEGKELVVNGL
jgi:hypothetical protein